MKNEKANDTEEKYTQEEEAAQEQTKREEQDAQSQGENENADQEENQMSKEDELKLEVAAWQDKYMRLHAEFDNFRKRNNKERLDLIKNASGDVLQELLPIVDDFERAIKANEEIEDVESLKEGYHLIHNKLLRALEAKGLKPMNSQGEPFDTDLHEAITNIEAPSEDLKGKVVDVVEKGYYLNDRVLRYAKVVVGK
ncbi:nucleotide exchange factor GrpE [Halocola ammonii]